MLQKVSDIASFIKIIKPLYSHVGIINLSAMFKML